MKLIRGTPSIFSRHTGRGSTALEPEQPYAIKYRLKHNSYRTERFSKQWICIHIKHWIWSSIQWTDPISRIVSNER